MKVLKRNRPQVDLATVEWAHRATCTGLPPQLGEANGARGCGAKVELTAKDVYYHEETKQLPMGIITNIGWSWICPCCGTENHVDNDDLPEGIEFMGKSEWLKLKRFSLLHDLFLNSGVAAAVDAAVEAEIEDLSQFWFLDKNVIEE